MGLVVYALVLTVASIVGYYASMAAQKSRDVSPGAVEQPTVNQGDRFGMLFGTREVADPKVVWTDIATTEAIKK